jgi:ADP-heptose:LPS heptosyltransferase
LNLSEPSSLLPGLERGAEILIIRLRSLGDVVLLTPALTAIHSWRPDLRLTVLVEPAWAPVLEGNPAIHDVIFAGGFFATALQLRKRKFAMVFNQHGGPTSALLTAATGARLRVCWKGRQFGFVYNVQVPDAVEFYGTLQVHSVEQRMAQFYWTGLPRGPIPPAAVFPQADARESVAAKLLRHGIGDGEAYAVIAPGARYFTKRWALDHFAAIAQWLRDAHGLRSVVLLGPDERTLAASAPQQFGTDVAIFHSLELRETIALIAGARLFAANDSGPAHIAAAVQVPSVTIFGSSSSVHWRPWQAPHRLVQNDFPCNPCPGDRCYAFDEPRCILSISVDQVREACTSLLAATPSSPRGRIEAS